MTLRNRRAQKWAGRNVRSFKADGERERPGGGARVGWGGVSRTCDRAGALTMVKRFRWSRGAENAHHGRTRHRRAPCFHMG